MRRITVYSYAHSFNAETEQVTGSVFTSVKCCLKRIFLQLRWPVHVTGAREGFWRQSGHLVLLKVSKLYSIATREGMTPN